MRATVQLLQQPVNLPAALCGPRRGITIVSAACTSDSSRPPWLGSGSPKQEASPGQPASASASQSVSTSRRQTLAAGDVEYEPRPSILEPKHPLPTEAPAGEDLKRGTLTGITSWIDAADILLHFQRGFSSLGRWPSAGTRRKAILSNARATSSNSDSEARIASSSTASSSTSSDVIKTAVRLKKGKKLLLRSFKASPAVELSAPVEPLESESSGGNKPWTMADLAKVGTLLLLSISYVHQATTGFALPAMLPMISKEMGLGDVQGALLTTGYSYLYAAALRPIGLLADKVCAWMAMRLI